MIDNTTVEEVWEEVKEPLIEYSSNLIVNFGESSLKYKRIILTK